MRGFFILILILISQLCLGQTEVDTIRIFYKDTSTVEFLEDLDYHFLHNTVEEKGHHFIIYYDQQFRNKKAELYSKADSSFRLHYFKNGAKSLEEVTYNSDLVYRKRWCENSLLIESIKFNVEVPVLVKTYHCNGIIEKEFYHSKYGYSGLFKSFYENGKLRKTGTYERNPGFNNERKTGKWEYFSSDGKKYLEVIYRNGEKIKELKF